MPRLHIVQAAACQPLVQAFNTGAAAPVAVERRPTIAGGIDVAVPARGAAVLEAARDTDGAAVAVSEDDIAATRSALARDEGLFVEATSAAAFAAAATLRAQGDIAAEDSVLIAATGSGLKDPPQQSVLSRFSIQEARCFARAARRACLASGLCSASCAAIRSSGDTRATASPITSSAASSARRKRTQHLPMFSFLPDAAYAATNQSASSWLA